MQIGNDFLEVNLHPHGAAIESLLFKVLDRNVVRVCEDRNAPCHYTNTIVGPTANRIAGGQFDIDGESFSLDQNEGQNTLHGGRSGLSELTWNVSVSSRTKCVFEIELEDGHMGFPGPSSFQAEYRLNGNAIEVELRADSVRKNAFNLAPHFYFNLDGSPSIDAHLLQIQADHYLPVDKAMLPLGKPKQVAGSDFDFLKPKPLAGINLDYNFCLKGSDLREVVSLEVGDLKLTVESNQSGVQIYDGRKLNREHMAIEPQGWPNAVNEPAFPSQEILAGQSYRSYNRFLFSELVGDNRKG
jgi:aldose 1-epimerase